MASPKGISQAEGRTDSAAGAYGGEAKLIDITAPATDEAKQWDGWGTALKPAHEPIVVARKPLIGTVAQNVLKYGTGGLNIDATRIGTETISVHNAPKGSFAGGEPERGSDTESYREHQGRFPANIILDETTAKLLDEQSGITKSLAHNRPHDTKWGFGVGNDNAKQYDYETGQTGYSDSGGASRFFYVAKASRRDRNEGLENIEGKEISAKGNGLARTCNTCGASTLDGCDCPDRTFSNPVRQNFHPTVKPTALMQYLIRLVTPDNGVVLDPFAGSGSTGKAAILEGKSFIGIELTPEYLPIIGGRLKHAYLTLDDKEADLFG
jgi:site-specific DNA-methyltransferase (adenine-specific)